MTKIENPHIIIDALEMGVMIINEEFDVLYWNQWLEINTGIVASEIIGSKLTAFYPDIDYRVFKRKIRTSLRLNGPTFYDSTHHNRFIEIPRTKITTSLLTDMQLQVTISPYNIDESLVMISIYDVSDLHELKLNLQDKITKIAQLNKELHQEQIIIDENLLIAKINQHFEIVDITNALSAFLGQNKESLVSQNLNNFFGENFNRTMIQERLNNENRWSGEIKVSSQSDEEVWLDAIITVIDDEVSDTRYTAIFHDITDKKRLEFLSITDPLTKLYNRNWFNESYQNLFMRRHWTPQNSFAVIIADIDYFKKINDTFGHLIGDKVLVHVANVLAKTIRNGDYIARWGGEEFVILLPYIDLENALRVAEKLRSAVENFPIDEVGTVTASFGLAIYTDNDHPESLLVRADDALYQAKTNGRNRIETL